MGSHSISPYSIADFAVRNLIFSGEDVSPYLIAGSCGVDAAEPLRQLDKTGQVIDVAEDIIKPSPELRRLLVLNSR
jgi:hypothetical protein